ncbi:teichoic acid D-Ala incorporation-associated protein DltX [Furfurilactobacillus curtus]|uniref:Cytochrome c554 n=1 Tax=Furfurilactobacillus curtus TaxID=1746200 RepID=A0ABQ5JTM0_9LACO
MAKIKLWLAQPWVTFILRTAFYFVVFFLLLYLYSYSGVNQSKFIYNEF